MDRAIPAPSKILQRKKKERDDFKLYKKLKAIKNSESVYNFRNRKQKSKTRLPRGLSYGKIQQNREIQRENRILAKKMIEIESKSSMPRLKPPNTTTTKEKMSKEKKNKPKTSLNKNKRKKEILKISMDNIKIMNRIQSMKSFYDTQKWKKDTELHQERLKMHCEYPVVVEKIFKKEKLQKSQINSERRKNRCKSRNDSDISKKSSISSLSLYKKPKPKIIPAYPQDLYNGTLKLRWKAFSCKLIKLSP